jgi:Glycosyl transferases group 1
LIKRIHIIAHDVPYPIDYGGVIDIFCTIKTLHQQGMEIILHCFDYGRGKQNELNLYCSEVNYYERKEGHKGFCFHLPYIVGSRSNPELLDRLSKDNFPILLEGIHCSFLLTDSRFNNRKIVLRAFNAESLYYKQLYNHERSLFKKAFFLNESRLLQHYETAVAARIPILTLTEEDARYFGALPGAKSVTTVPVLLPYQQVKTIDGIGSFCLYHGNLSVAENEKAAVWLLEEVFVKLKIPIVIAGKKPSARLARIAHMSCHTCLIADPGEKELNDLISKAQINILPSFNETGIKLKLLNALYNGRHCIVNNAAVVGTPLGPLCHIAEKAVAVQRIVQQLYYLPFGEEELRLREKILYPHFNNEANGQSISSYLQ